MEAVAADPNAPTDTLVDKELFGLVLRTLPMRHESLLEFYGAAREDEQLDIRKVVQKFPHLANFRMV